jgi:HK97 family phage prohead protease
MTEKKISASMRERKRMAYAMKARSLDDDGRFAGYASVFDIVDNQRDIMLKGAFVGVMKKGAGAVKLLWQHQPDEPIGVFEKIFEDKFGLYVEGRLLLDVQKAKEAHALLKAGAVSGLSIGYSPVRYKIDGKTGVRLLAEVDLFEVSLVTFPANSAATVTVVKADANKELAALTSALDRAVHVLRP